MQDYCQEVGQAGRDRLPAGADIFYNAYDISKSRKNMSDTMRNFVQSKECKRKLILRYFDHPVPNNQNPAHMCCDFHSRQCSCDDCELAQAVEDIEVDTQPGAVHTPQDQGGEELKEATLYFDAEVKTKIKVDLIQYRANLQRELGRSTVGGVGLSSGLSIALIDLALQHLPELTSVRSHNRGRRPQARGPRKTVEKDKCAIFSENCATLNVINSRGYTHICVGLGDSLQARLRLDSRTRHMLSTKALINPSK